MWSNKQFANNPSSKTNIFIFMEGLKIYKNTHKIRLQRKDSATWQAGLASNFFFFFLIDFCWNNILDVGVASCITMANLDGGGDEWSNSTFHQLTANRYSTPDLRDASGPYFDPASVRRGLIRNALLFVQEGSGCVEE